MLGGVAEDSEPVAIDVLTNDTDSDGDPLSISALGSPSAGGNFEISGGSIVYQPAPNFNGAETVTYTVVDGRGGSSSALLTVTVTSVNDAPFYG